VRSGMCVDQRLQFAVRRLHRLDFCLAGALAAVIEVVDTHVMVEEGPACSLRFREIGIAVGSMQPCTSDIEGNAEMFARRVSAAADATHGFNELDRSPGGLQVFGGRKSRRTGPYNHNIDIFHCQFPSSKAAVISEAYSTLHARASTLRGINVSSNG